jgi:hypothetical protein
VDVASVAGKPSDGEGLSLAVLGCRAVTRGLVSLAEALTHWPLTPPQVDRKFQPA